ncbi:hypothetical protein CsSME_00006877 [Camellia sinensis var. sinensis]
MLSTSQLFPSASMVSSHYMTPHLSLLQNCTPPSFSITVNAANGSGMSVIFVGSVLLSAMFAVSILSVFYDRMSKQQIGTGSRVGDLYVHTTRIHNCFPDALATLGAKVDIPDDSIAIAIEKRTTLAVLTEGHTEQDAEGWRADIIQQLKTGQGTIRPAELASFLLLRSELYFCGPIKMEKESTELQRQCAKCQSHPKEEETHFLSSEEWRQPYIDYLGNGTLLENKADAIRIKRQAVPLACLSKDEANEVLRKAHKVEH